MTRTAISPVGQSTSSAPWTARCVDDLTAGLAAGSRPIRHRLGRLAGSTGAGGDRV